MHMASADALFVSEHAELVSHPAVAGGGRHRKGMRHRRRQCHGQ
ncbi:Uncharacterised protein [Mycobacteroides abscessus subsp. abscessus]|nr:Uncharacterised protein [Mycobacteroides abscessus subsp. abscessus]